MLSETFIEIVSVDFVCSVLITGGNLQTVCSQILTLGIVVMVGKFASKSLCKQSFSTFMVPFIY